MIATAEILSLIPIVFGIIIYFSKKETFNKVFLFLSIILPFAGTILLAALKTNGSKCFFRLGTGLEILGLVDKMGLFFAVLASVAFLLVAIFGLSYFKEDLRKNKFDAFFLMSYGGVLLLCFAGNLITMYICFEMVTLLSMPMVLHDKTKESIDAAVKYLLYSIGGAFLGFIGVVWFSSSAAPLANNGIFTFGGCLSGNGVQSAAAQVILFLMLVGFGAKCGLFPLHNWLPTAHPVAPAPASALLSGIITKSGIVAILRIVYYVVGPEYIKGTWVHTAWIVLILVTILLGSFMAVVQKNFKKRLAFSTVSQVSYVLLGIAMLDTEGLSGSFLQVISHATIKIGLFLVAGALIHCLGIHDVDEIEGAGKRMPITMWCYTICALGLVGVPPTSGFVAKWYLASGALNSGLGLVSVIAPIVLIVSAILTAYYLLSCTVKAFFPKDKEKVFERVNEPVLVVIPLIVLACLSVLIGIFGSALVNFVGGF